MELLRSKQKLTEQEIIDFEEKIGKELPIDFKEFYFKNNGGLPSLEFFLEYQIVYFNPIKYGEYILETAIEGLKDLLPVNSIPFASDGGGLPYYMSLEEDSYGHIFYLDHTYEEILLTTSFTEFINGFSIEPVY